MNEDLFIKLELRINQDGRVFLNFWDTQKGDDLCIQIEDEIFLIEGFPITIETWLKLIKDRL